MHSSGSRIALSHETVSDSVSYAPNLEGGGYASATQRPRYQSHGLTWSTVLDRSTRFQVSVVQRQLNSVRDSFEINAIETGVLHRLEKYSEGRYSVVVGLLAGVNHSSEIYKNSYTNYGDQLITEVRLVEPRDGRLSVSADLSIELTPKWRVSLAMSAGLSQTDQKQISGVARLENDCNYQFTTLGSGGVVRQLDSCGSLKSFEQQYPDNQTLADRLGFSVTDDVSYRDYFFDRALSLHFSHGRWSASAGYRFRQYHRPIVDQRIRDAGETPVSGSQAGFAGVTYQMTPNWKIDFQARYQQAAFLDDVPFLYSALTHRRYEGNGVVRYGIALTRFLR